MALVHKFYLVKIDNINLLNLKKVYSLMDNEVLDDIKFIEKIELHDDIFGYVQDTLNWVPSKTLLSSPPQESKGFNRHGITILDNTSVIFISEISKGWIKIFEQAPEKIELTGAYVSYEGENGKYEILEVNKQDLINKLKQIEYFSTLLNKENYYIIHLGI